MKQASSYDRRSVSPDLPGWFANDDQGQYIGVEEKGDHKELVMFDADGPGAIVRFWLTTSAKPGTMRFYFDGEGNASVKIPAFDLMKGGFKLGPALLNPHSSYDPDGKGGNTLYMPIPYQKHCKITWQEPDTPQAKQARYYQVNYRTYPLNTKVKTFGKDDLVAERTLIDKVENTLWNPVSYSGKSIGLNKNIEPGKEILLRLPPKTSAIRSFTLNVTTSNSDYTAQALRSVVLKIVFDDQVTVWCPAGDFSGSGVGGRKIKSWYRETDSQGKISSRWVMPYKRNATIYLMNTANIPVYINMEVNVGDWVWNNRSMYFHAAWKHEVNIRDTKWDYDVTKVAKKDTAGPVDWNFTAVKGKGVYLGNTLSVFNHMHTWYGEGDAKIWVDKDTFPSEFGTGLEDYYNTSWAPVVLYQTPFANAPRADNADSYGYNTFTRTRILDRVPFDNSFRYDMEMLSWETGKINTDATVYWYGFAAARDNSKRNKREAKQLLP